MKLLRPYALRVASIEPVGDAFELYQREHFVIDIHLPARTFSALVGSRKLIETARLQRTFANISRDDRVDRRDLTDEVTRHVDDMRADVADGAGAGDCLLEAP